MKVSYQGMERVAHAVHFKRELRQANREGRKTMTRRVVTKCNSSLGSGDWPEDGLDRAFPQRDGSKLMLPGVDDTHHRLWPSYVIGDLLWCHEPVMFKNYEQDDSYPCGVRCWMEYLDDKRICDEVFIPARVKTPPLTGPWGGRTLPVEWARDFLEITEVRVERVQDISEDEAEAEGVSFLREIPDADETLSGRKLFEILWDHINASRGFGWEKNPWVWVIAYKYFRVNPGEVRS